MLINRQRGSRSCGMKHFGIVMIIARSFAPASSNAPSMSGTALAQIESMSRIFFDGIGVGATLSDIRTSRMLFANTTFARMVGYTVDELTSGMSFLDLTHPDDRERNLQIHAKLT